MLKTSTNQNQQVTTSEASVKDSNKKVVIQQLVQNIAKATLRPLYAEVILHNRALCRNIDNFYLQTSRRNKFDQNQPENSDTAAVRSSPTTLNRPKGRSSKINDDRSWVELLNEVQEFIPYLSDDEHGEILRLCSILLLAYLLPYSTGMDYYMTQNRMIPTTASSGWNTTEKFSVDEYIIRMSLQERLEKVVINSLSSNAYGSDESTTLTDQDVDIAFGDLLDQISNILIQRPVHSHQVDLLHVMAMMIHPCHFMNSSTSKRYFYTSSVFMNSPSYLAAIQLMENPIGTQFQIHYGHRRQMVQIVRQCIVISDDIQDYTPIYTGALPHLFTSIRQFCCHTSTCREDSNDALRTLFTLLVQCRYKDGEGQDDYSLLKSECDWLVQRMTEDQEENFCLVDPAVGMDDTEETNQGIARVKTDSIGNYKTCGSILSEIIVSLGLCRKSASTEFLPSMANALKELIEWQVDSWIHYPDDEQIESTRKQYSPFLLAELLHCAKRTFYFHSEATLVSTILDDYDDDDPYVTMIHSSIALLRHPDHTIVRASSDLLIQAFTSEKFKKMDSLTSMACTIITSPTIQKNGTMPLLQSLVAVLSSISYSIAVIIADYLLGDKEKTPVDIEIHGWIRRGLSMNEAGLWLAAVGINCPSIGSEYQSTLLLMASDQNLPLHNRYYVCRSLLFSRLAHYFPNNSDTDVSTIVANLALNDFSNWDRYKLATHAMVSGHFSLSQKIYRKLLADCSNLDSSQHLWISLLERVSAAENLLSTSLEPKSRQGGVLGIPGASSRLYSAISYLETLIKTSSFWKDRGTFQLRFLLLRLDLLDLITIARHLIREKRLTGKSPSKSTRSYWHVQNVERSFHILASRLYDIYSQCGLNFRHNQSITVLAMLQSLCSFLAAATRKCF